MTLFDPGWRGEQTKGPEDWGVADLGNDPMGIIDRCGGSANHLQTSVHVHHDQCTATVECGMYMSCSACDITCSAAPQDFASQLSMLQCNMLKLMYSCGALLQPFSIARGVQAGNLFEGLWA